jgi:Tol biopolymer transport system component
MGLANRVAVTLIAMSSGRPHRYPQPVRWAARWSACALALALATVAAEPAAAAYSGASNGQISFVSDRDPLFSANRQAVIARKQIFVMGPDGQNPTNLSTSAEDHADPAFSADGRLIAFAGFPDAEDDQFGSEEIYVMNADGTDKRRLTTTPADESEPAFSPDGSRIAFTSLAQGGFHEIDVMNADGSDRSRLLGGGEVSFSDPAWSPDGSKIAFSRSDDQQVDVWAVDLTSGAQTRLTNGFEVEDQPDWSPDGSRIAYVNDPFLLSATKLVSNPDIWVMNADGSGKARLTSHPWEDTNPAWSPDGSKIAFTHRQNQGTDPHTIENYPGDVYVMNADGADQRNLTNGGLTGIFLDEEASDNHSPSWQPLGPNVNRTPPSFTGTVSVPPLLAISGMPTQPVISAASRRRRGGVAIRFRLSKRASVKLAVESLRRGRKARRGRRSVCVPTGRRVARRKRCTVRKLRGWIVRRGKRGRNRVRFSGRIGRRALRPGRYRIRAGAVDRIANPARQKQSRLFRVVR